MNLHGLASGAIGTVNPFITGTVKVSTGYTTSSDYKQVPAYDVYENVSMQVQALTFEDLKQLDGLNLNGTQRAIYMNGRADGVVRSLMKGGDLIIITHGVNTGTWLINKVIEQWPDWVKYAMTLQNEPAP